MPLRCKQPGCLLVDHIYQTVPMTCEFPGCQARMANEILCCGPHGDYWACASHALERWDKWAAALGQSTRL